MGKQFFVGWATWEKLVFCLAAAIFLTVSAAGIKLAHTRWQLRKYGPVTGHQRRAQAQKQMSEKSAPSHSHQNDHVPFGIRAIERGVEVDGVYISRSNTPDRESAATSTESSVWDHVSGKYREIDLEKQDDDRSVPNLQKTPIAKPTIIPGAAIVPVRDRSSSADRRQGSRGGSMRGLSPVSAMSRPPRSFHPPSSYARFRNTSRASGRRKPSTASTLDAIEAIHNASMQIKPAVTHDSAESFHEHSTFSGNDSSSITAAAPMLFSAPSASVDADRSASDLSLLNSHRFTQAAETGQLAPRPRSRKPSLSGSVLSVNTSSTSLARYIDTCSMPRSAAASPTFPRLNSVPETRRRSSAPDVQAFNQFCQSVAQSDPYDSQHSSPLGRGGSSWYLPQSGSALSDYTSAGHSQASLPIIESNEGKSSGRSSFEKIESDVLRGHGSGFEILNPRSLPPSQSITTQPSEGPPIALYKASSRRSRSLSVSGRNKLQKERYTGMDLSAKRKEKESNV